MQISEAEADSIALALIAQYREPLAAQAPPRPPTPAAAPQFKTITKKVVEDVKQTEANQAAPLVAILAAFVCAFGVAALTQEAPLAGILLLAIAGLSGSWAAYNWSHEVTRRVAREIEMEVEIPQFASQPDAKAPVAAGATPSKLELAVERVSLPLLSVHLGDSRLIVDASETAPPTTMSLARLRNADAARAAFAEYDRILAMPIPAVLQQVPAETDTGTGTSELVGLEAQLESALRSIQRALADVETERIALPLLQAADLPQIGALRRLSAPPNMPKLLGELRRAIAALHRATTSLTADEFDAPLASISWHMECLTEIRDRSLHDVIAPLCANIGQDFHYSAFNFFCPDCNASAQQELVSRDYSVSGSSTHQPVSLSPNSRCRYDLQTSEWECVSCGTRTFTPIPVHRLLDELLLPTFDRLMEENKNERIAAYHEARSRDLEYANAMQTELENLLQSNRRDVESLLQEQGRLGAQAAGEEEALVGLRSVQDAYRVKQSALAVSMLAGHAAIVKEIQATRTEAQNTMSQAFSTERDAMVEAMNKCSRAKRIEDEQRDTVMRDIAVNMRRTAAASETTAVNTGRMAVTLDRVESNTRRTANASETTARNTGQLVKLGTESVKQLQYGNAISAAMAERAGVSRSPGFLDLGGWVNKGLNDMTSGILGEDAISRHARYNKSKFD